MKSIVVTAVALVMGMNSFGQVKPSTNPGGFILKGGVNRANVSVTDDGRIDEANNLTSFHVGGIVDLPLGDFLSLQPGLLFTGKGSKTSEGALTSNTYNTATSNPMYLEVPVNLVAKINMGGTSNFFIGGGPYAAMGISGKNRVEGKIFGAPFSSERNINFSNDDPTTSQEENAGYGKLKRFDYGLNALAGFELSKFTIGAGYGLGFAKINSNTNNNANDNGKHRVLSLSVGVKF